MEGLNTFLYYVSAIGIAGTIGFLICLLLLKDSVESKDEMGRILNAQILENTLLLRELERLKMEKGHIKTMSFSQDKEVFFCGLGGQARKDRYKQLVKLLHPDNGGDKQLFQKMMEEYEK